MADFVHLAPFPARFAAPLRDAAVSWPDSITAEEQQLIDVHGMLSIVYERSRLPALREAAMYAAAVEALQLTDLRDVLGALEARGVVPLIVKGTALAYSIYASPDLRSRSDTDVLIDADQIDIVRATLLPMGFTERLTSGDELGVRQHSFVRTDRFGVVHAYDVHLAIANPAVVARALTYDGMRARAMALPRVAPEAIAPSLVDSLLYACIHRVVHHHGSDRLIWLYDVHLISGLLSAEERDEFWTMAKERRVVTICKRTIEDAATWFGGSEMASDAPSVDEEPSAAFLERDRTRGAILADELSVLTLREKVRRLRQLAFPPAAFMRQSFGVRSNVALPFLYVWRGMRGIRRLFRRI